jgi:hypothetical protein
MLIKMDVVQYLIGQGPGRTAVELAQAIHGPLGYQQNVNQECEMLTHAGRVERRGAGGPTDPYRYFLK